MSAAGLSDRARLLEQRQRLVMVAVPGGYVSQPHHVRSYARHEPDIPAQPHRQRAANLATIRAAVIAALKDAGYLHIPEGRRDHTAPAETLRLHGLD